MKDATLLTAAPCVSINNMMLTSTSMRRENGRMVYSATVEGEATSRSMWDERTRTVTATATGASPHGAQLKAYAKCVREIAGAGPFPEAFAADIESLEADQP